MITELYLTESWHEPLEREDFAHCTKLSIGHCAGCVAITQTANRFRWQRRDPGEVANEMAQIHCPPNLSPDINAVVNNMASFGMGQRREEIVVFDGVEPDPNGYKLHGNY